MIEHDFSPGDLLERHRPGGGLQLQPIACTEHPKRHQLAGTQLANDMLDIGDRPNRVPIDGYQSVLCMYTSTGGGLFGHHGLDDRPRLQVLVELQTEPGPAGKWQNHTWLSITNAHNPGNIAFGRQALPNIVLVGKPLDTEQFGGAA